LIYLLGRFGRTLRQRADLLGHHREAPARLSGPGGLDAGIERQQVRLESDLVDDADDLTDLV
jgi:hypothetical protein